MNDAHQALGAAIDERKDALALAIVDEQWARHPQFHALFSEAGRAECVRDVRFNLAYLAQALAANSPPLFAAYVEWVKALFEGLKIPTGELSESLDITGTLLQQRFPETAGIVAEFIALGRQRLTGAAETMPSFFDESQPLAALGQQYMETLLSAERAASSRLILDAVAQGASVKDVYLHVFQPSQRGLGRLWQMNRMTVAQEHCCTAVTQLIMSQLYGHIFNTTKHGHRLVTACVGDERHEIGLRMVTDFFEMDGWDTYYLGSNMPTVSVVQALTERQADVLAISATMAFHVPLVAGMIRQVRSVPGLRHVRIMVGGYPFNIEPALWGQVGADGHAPDAEQSLITGNAWIAR